MSTTVRITAAQQTIIDGITAGLRNKEIARMLGISPRTVESHLVKLRRTFGARTAAQLAVMLDRQRRAKFEAGTRPIGTAEAA